MSGKGQATAISTVAVRSGDEEIVIALLKHKDTLELKVVEVKPQLTQLASSLAEALSMQQAHADVITKIQSKTSPVEELYRRADEVLRQNDDTRVYQAMADSLSLVWESVNDHLKSRQELLQLNLDYFRHLKDFDEKSELIEKSCSTELPVEIEIMQQELSDIKELYRQMLVTLSNTLYQGNKLLQFIASFVEKGTLDSRPDHIRKEAEQSRQEVERWLESLHGRRQTLQGLVEARSQALSQCLALALLTADLALLARRTEHRLAGLDLQQLGEDAASAALLLAHIRDATPEAKEFQEQAMKIVKATEEFAEGGHFAGPEAITQAYSLLELTAAYLDQLQSNEALLQRAEQFFTEATKVLQLLNELEQEKLGQLNLLSEEEMNKLLSQLPSTIEEITSKTLNEGYALLRESPNAQGIKQMVEKIENKKIELNVDCIQRKEEFSKGKLELDNFIGKHNQLSSFLSSMDAYLTGVQDVGTLSSAAKTFLQILKTNSVDLQAKQIDLTALKSLVPRTCEAVSEQKAQLVKSMMTSVQQEFHRLTEQLELRVKLVSLYIRVLTMIEELHEELDTLERLVTERSSDTAAGEKASVASCQISAQLDNLAANYIHDVKENGWRGGVDTVVVVEENLREVRKRKEKVTSRWAQLVEDSSRRARDEWQAVVMSSNQTVDWVSRLDSQLYPVLNRELHGARQLASHVEHKVKTVLPEIRRAEQEIQLRIQTAQALISKGGVNSSEGVPVRLKDLNSRLEAISSDYQILLDIFLNFFSQLSQLQDKIELSQKKQMMHCAATSLSEAQLRDEEFIRERQLVSEMMNQAIVESGHVINKIKSLESNWSSDVMTVERCVETLRYDWQRLVNERERVLEMDQQRCRFDVDLHAINNSVDQLASRLSESKSHHGSDLPSALHTRQAFGNFEATIQILDEKIHKFLESGEDMLVGTLGGHVEKELAALQRKWQSLKHQVVETKNIIDIAVKYFTLVKEAQEWFEEGRLLLESIIKESTYVKTAQEASLLLEKINLFLKPGEQRQQQRIDEIVLLAEKLQKLESPMGGLVREDSQQMIDSFTKVTTELRTIMGKLDFQSPQPMEGVTHILEVTTTQLKKDSSLSPVPPKKQKMEDKTPEQIEAPSFIIPLSDQLVNEGSKLKFECRVAGSPFPDISWYKDGISIQNNLDYKTKCDSGLCSLIIEETFADDSATFCCRAENKAGKVETSARLTVKEIEREEEPHPPEFEIPLSEKVLREGDSLELQCKVRGLPLPTVQWMRGSVCLDNDPRYSTTYNNGDAVLSCSSVSLKDDGTYSCIATNSQGSQTTSSHITVKYNVDGMEVPKFTRGLENVMARAGEKIKLEVEATGVPLPKISWTRDGVPIKSAKVEAGVRSVLEIEEAFPKDGGRYSVRAENLAGVAETEAAVTVKGWPADSGPMQASALTSRPVVQLHLRDQCVFESKRLRLDCVIVGHPEPEVIWYHNEKPVKESQDIQLLFQGDRCSLVIKEAFLEDAGSYRVVAINSGGQAESTCNITVQPVDRSTEGGRRLTPQAAEPSSSDSKPFFTKLLTDVFSAEGDTVSLDCCVGGSPLPTVTWLLNNNDLQQSDRIHMSQDSEGNSLLRISCVTGEDRGVYTARASNQLGEAKSFSHLNVKTSTTSQSVPMSDKQLAPNFSQLFADRTVVEGQSTKFECIVGGKPAPKVRWLFNDTPVSGTDFLVSTSGNRQVLTIPWAKKSLAGKVSCVAESEAGKAVCSAILTIQDDVLGMLGGMPLGLRESSTMEVKTSSFKHSSMKTSTSMSSTGPHFEEHSLSSESHMAARKIGDKPMTKMESHSSSEYSNVDGVETKSDFKSKSDTIEPSALPKMIISPRKSSSPKFVLPLTGCIVDQGADIKLEAIVEGYPNPSVSWSRNGAPIPTGAETSFNLNRAVLLLRNVNNTHSGRYTLTASNEAGTNSSTADIVVKKTSFPPVMGRRLQANTALLGERVSMEIEVTGTPTPTVAWFKDDKPLDISQGFRILNQGNCHSIIIEKADFKHSGQYAANASNSAGEAKSTADLLVVEPMYPVKTEPPASSFYESSTHKESSRLSESVKEPFFLKEPAPVTMPKAGTVVSESVTSEKHVSMKVEHKAFGFEKSVIPEMTKPEKIVRFDETPVTIDRERSEDGGVIESSVSKQSSLDFFKSIIKENEAMKEKECEATKVSSSEMPSFKFLRRESLEKHGRPISPPLHIQPGPPPEMGFIPKVSSPPPKEEMIERVKKLQESNRTLAESEIPTGGIKFYPIPVSSKTEPKKPCSPVNVVDKMVFPERKQSIQMDYSFKNPVVEEIIVPQQVELPATEGFMQGSFGKRTVSSVIRHVEPPQGRVITPTPQAELLGPPLDLPDTSLLHKTETSTQEQISLDKSEQILRPSANIPLRPASPRPSAEAVSMEKLWTSSQKKSTIEEHVKTTAEMTKVQSPVTVVQEKPFTEKPFTEKPIVSDEVEISSVPRLDALAMEKQWGHKFADGKLKSVWPPPVSDESVQSSTSNFVSSEVTKTLFKTQTETKAETEVKASIQPVQAPLPSQQFQPFEPVSAPTIYYVAEAHATHKTTLPSSMTTSTTESFETSENMVQQQFHHSEERNILPSEAKKVWPEGPPISFEPRGFATSNLKSNVEMEDVVIEPGPPPEIVYATPVQKERRQSYVETIEQDLEKDLQKEPTKHIVGSVRTIPPPRKESLVEQETKPFEIEEKKVKTEAIVTSPAQQQFTSALTQQKEVSQKFFTIPRPSKFVKKTGFESDYESDIDNTKIKARWTPWDSDVEEPTYRRVKPPESRPQRAHSTEPQPLAPSQFDKGPIITQTSVKSMNESFSKKTESNVRSIPIKTEQMNGTALKPGSPPQYINMNKPESPVVKKTSPFHDSGYMADTDEPRQSFRQSKSSQYSKTEKKVTTSKLDKETSVITSKIEMEKPEKRIQAVSPSKFVKREWRESDYDSDYESRMKETWRPSGPGFRPVKPVFKQFEKKGAPESVFKPQPVQFDLKPGSPPEMAYAPPPPAIETSSSFNFAESTEKSSRVVSMKQTTRVIGYDKQKQTKQTLPAKIVPAGEAKWASDSESDTTRVELSRLEEKAEKLRLQRIEEMRKRFSSQDSSKQALTPGAPPTFDFAPRVSSNIASQHLSEMKSGFKERAQKFSSEIMKDLKEDRQLKGITSGSEPQVYRHQNKQMEKGSKHIDPDTGLIYFKYDFGYEFGLVSPGKGSLPEDSRGSIEVPVTHERTIGWSPEVTQEAQTTASKSESNLRTQTLSPSHGDTPQKPQFITPLRDIAVLVGDSGRFECIVQGEPTPNVVWKKGGQIIESSPNYNITFRNGVCRLTIHHVFSEEQGTYECLASNQQGSTATSAVLTVSGEARTYI